MKVDVDKIAEDAQKPLDYFSHDADAASDVKCRKLIRRCGMAGYGRWWRVCEMLAAATGHALSVTCEEDVDMLADDLEFDSPEELVDFLHTLCELGLLSGMGDGVFTSDRMTDNAMKVGAKRAAGRLGGRPRKDAVKIGLETVA